MYITLYCFIIKYNYLIFLVRLLYGLCAACCPPSTLTVEGCSDDNEKQVLIEEFSKSVYIKKRKQMKIITLCPDGFELHSLHVHTHTRLTRWHFSGVLFAVWHWLRSNNTWHWFMDVPRWRHRNRAGQVPAQPSAASRTYSTIAVPTVLTFLRSENVNNNNII